MRHWLAVNGDSPAAGADPGFLPGEGAKGMMTLYGIGMSDFWHAQTQICNFSRCLLSFYVWMVLNNHSRDTSVPSFCPWDEGTRDFGAGPSVPGVGARPSAPPPPWIRAWADFLGSSFQFQFLPCTVWSNKKIHAGVKYVRAITLSSSSVQTSSVYMRQQKVQL